MKNIHDRQSSLAEFISSTNSSVEQLQDTSESLRLDVDHINEIAEKNAANLEKFEDDLERLNVAQISSNMRIFGLDVNINESELAFKNKVIRYVLRKAFPEGNWVPEDIKRVQIVSTDDSDKSPILIVHFRYDDDKFRIYQGRDELRKNGLRVGDDLTYRQRQQLKALKLEGNTGYFLKGKLHVRDKQDNVAFNDASQRTYRTVTRKQNLEDQGNVHRDLNFSNVTAIITDQTIPNSSRIDID